MYNVLFTYHEHVITIRDDEGLTPLLSTIFPLHSDRAFKLLQVYQYFTALFTGSIFHQNLKIFHEYLIQLFKFRRYQRLF